MNKEDFIVEGEYRRSLNAYDFNALWRLSGFPDQFFSKRNWLQKSITSEFVIEFSGTEGTCSTLFHKTFSMLILTKSTIAQCLTRMP